MGQKYVYLPELFKLSKEEKLIIWVSEWGLASLEAELWKPIAMGCAFKESRGGLAVWFSCTIQEPRSAPAFSVEKRWVKQAVNVLMDIHSDVIFCWCSLIYHIQISSVFWSQSYPLASMEAILSRERDLIRVVMSWGYFLPIPT